MKFTGGQSNNLLLRSEIIFIPAAEIWRLQRKTGLDTNGADWTETWESLHFKHYEFEIVSVGLVIREVMVKTVMVANFGHLFSFDSCCVVKKHMPLW